MCFADQALFHPQRYCAGLARAFAAEGGQVFEHSAVTDVSGGPPRRLKTEGGSVLAEHVFLATHIPFLDSGLYFARTHPERSYVVVARVGARVRIPEGMYINVGSPTRSIRSHPLGGERVLLVGGEGHKVGQADNTRERYGRLEVFARQPLAGDLRGLALLDPGQHAGGRRAVRRQAASRHGRPSTWPPASASGVSRTAPPRR